MMPIVVTLSPVKLYRPDAIVIGLPGSRIWVAGVEAYDGYTTQSRICAALLCASLAGYVNYDELIEYIWGDDENGGPLSPTTYIAASIARRRNALVLAAANIRIRNHWGRGLFVERAEPGRAAA